MEEKARPVPDSWAAQRVENRKQQQSPAPAVRAPAAAPTTRRRYRVTGGRAVFGIEPGAVGELSLTEAQEGDLIEAGHIAPAANRALPVIIKEDESHG